jgi:hypothetical protein
LPKVVMNLPIKRNLHFLRVSKHDSLQNLQNAVSKCGQTLLIWEVIIKLGNPGHYSHDNGIP